MNVFGKHQFINVKIFLIYGWEEPLKEKVVSLRSKQAQLN